MDWQVLVLVILGFLIVIVLGVVAFAIRQKFQPSYRILVLGPAGSGKTLFLASMYYRLSVLNSTGFFLKTRERKHLPEQIEALRKYLERLRNPDEEDFSVPTLLSELTEWRFFCNVRVGSRNHSLARLSFYDYAGERIRYQYNTQKFSPEFRRVLDKASVLLAVLDGQELLKLMQNKENNFEKDVVNDILPILTNKPPLVYFMITKWDLLQGHYSLDDVLSRLMASSRNFSEFVHAQREHGTLRLIPVSSVGFDFADFVHSDDRMLKKPNSKFEPYQVEMPLVSVMFDEFNSASKKFRWFNQLAHRGRIGELFAWLLLLIVTTITVNVGSFTLSPAILYVVATGHSEPQPGQGHPERRAAFRQLIERTQKLVLELKRKFPKSDLSDL
jgi:hypothetical protein